MKKGMGGGGMQQLLKQANQMQNKMKKVQEELAEKEYDGTAGGGAVTVTVNGNYFLVKMNINEEAIDPEDKDMLQDMIVSATNDAIKTAKETSEQEMSKITGGFGMPGMF